MLSRRFRYCPNIKTCQTASTINHNLQKWHRAAYTVADPQGKPRDQLKIIITVVVISSFRFIWIPMSWVYGYHTLIILSNWLRKSYISHTSLLLRLALCTWMAPQAPTYLLRWLINLSLTPTIFFKCLHTPIVVIILTTIRSLQVASRLLYFINIMFNPFRPEFTLVIFIHYKPRIAVAIHDL